jgi:hypothetical protein
MDVMSKDSSNSKKVYYLHALARLWILLLWPLKMKRSRLETSAINLHEIIDRSLSLKHPRLTFIFS